MGDSQNQDNAMPDTASPYEAAPGTTFSGWGKLVPLGCTVPATDLVGNVYTIGRDMKRCEVSITEYDIKPDIHKQISKIHCRISRRKIGTARKEVVILEDLSSNGTFVNGKKIGKNEYMIIDSEDEISFAAPQNKIFLFIDGAKLDFIYPKELTDKYFVTEHIGTGGFAEVYQMLHKKTCQPFALKKISKAGVPERKIFNEIGIMKKLHHECIVQMIEVLQTQTAAFIVMEYVPDGTLLDRLKRDRRLDEHLCKTVMLQLAWAVQYLHEQGVTHRDIKPENILIEDRPKNLLRVKVADFGLSKIISSITNLKTACGTLQYTAPEILEAKGMKQYTDKVDMWGLGVVLFICLSGRRPFLAKPNDTHALIKLILRGSYSISTPEWTLITSSAKLLVKKLLAVNPAERWDTKQILESDWLQLAKGDNVDELMVDLFGHSPKFP